VQVVSRRAGGEAVNAITHALDYIGRGWLVVPVRPRAKRPVENKWQQQKITADRVSEYFKPDFNVGVLLGDESGGLVDVDLDCPEAIALATELLPATRAFGRESSPRSHLLYYAMHARTEKFQQPLSGNKKKMLVEIRANKSAGDGEGLQTVFPGSVHESGELVEWDEADAEILRIAPEDLRRAVARLASAALLMRIGWPFARALAFGRMPTAGALSGEPDAVYALIARWLGLQPRQEQRAAPAPARRTTTPDDNRLKRASAYLARIPGGVSGAGGHDQTWTAALAVVRGFDLSESDAYSLLASEYNHKCDPPWSERELRHKIADALNNARIERGYLLKAERPHANGTNGANGYHHHAPPAPAAPGEPSAPAEWEPPVDFGVFDLPPFPVEALPPVLGDFVSSLAVATQTPPDLAGMMVLAACAATCAKRIVVEVKPGYREPLNLFTLAVLPSGHRKSAVLEEVARPLREWEAKRAEDLAPELARHAQKWAISKKRLDSVADRAAKAKSKAEREQLEQEVEDLAEQHSKLTVPAEPRILADDVTPEALGSLLATYEGRIAILSAEGGVFQQMAGKYSDSPSLDVYLKAHVGDEIRVDRKGRQSERVSKPALTLGISPQPIILEALAEKQMLRGTGLLARFLYALPTSMLGARTGDPPPVPEAVRSAYGTALRRLLMLQQQKHTLTLKFSPEAYAAWREFYLWVEPQLGEGGELESISDWGSKLPGSVARIAGILGILGILALNRDSEDLSISIYIKRDEVARAIALGRYLLPHARAAFSSMGADPKIQGAKHVLKTIRRKAWTSFSRRELQQSVKGSERFNDADQIDLALHVLEERGFIRPTLSPSMSERGRGRPAGSGYEVNPYTHRQKSQNSQYSTAESLPERTPGEDDE
jgi:replicative DNA helicase